ncbi:MAG: hypothetical protein AAF750_11560 [Planctomycetota bacterium]
MANPREDSAPLDDDGTYALASASEPSPSATGSYLGLAEHTVPGIEDDDTLSTANLPPGRAIECCARCGYDLTGLDLTTACPECGSNERRVDTAKRPVANAGWLTTIHRGVKAAWAAIAIAIGISVARLLFGQGWTTPWLNNAPADAMLMDVAKLIGAVAMFLLTQPNPALLGPGTSATDRPAQDPTRHDETPQYSKFIWPAPPRQLARYGAAVFAVAQLLMLACWLRFPAQLEPISFAAGAVGGLALFAGLTHFADVFDQLGQDQQAFETRILRVGWLIALIGTAAYFLVLPGLQPANKTKVAAAAVLVLLIVVMLFWSFALLIHLGQVIHSRLAETD